MLQQKHLQRTQLHKKNYHL